MKKAKRSCGDCTRCCEGWLHADIHGREMMLGKPCHFVTLGKGCTIYKERPELCKDFQCEWLRNDDLPEWYKPDLSSLIVRTLKLDQKDKDPIYYLEVMECGKTIDAKHLNWIVTYCLNNGYNLRYQIEGGWNLLGSKEFLLFGREPEEVVNTGK
jgi:hypothetical protein